MQKAVVPQNFKVEPGHSEPYILMLRIEILKEE